MLAMQYAFRNGLLLPMCRISKERFRQAAEVGGCHNVRHDLRCCLCMKAITSLWENIGTCAAPTLHVTANCWLRLKWFCSGAMQCSSSAYRIYQPELFSLGTGQRLRRKVRYAALRMRAASYCIVPAWAAQERHTRTLLANKERTGYTALRGH